MPLRFTFVAVLLLISPAFAHMRDLHGVVTDSAGAVVTNATLSDAWGHLARTDAEGKFHLAAMSGELTVRAPGFAEEHISVPEEHSNGIARLTIHLAIARPEELISVSAANGMLAPESTTFTAADLRLAPSLTLDEALRSSPGFSLFRRAPSWTANPTTQGVSLQGTGSSAASRALVLQDGFPLNDPFGGWVYWQRIPTTTPERVELLTGGGSGIYGSDAIGGAINIISPSSFASTTDATHAALDFSYGNLNSPGGSASVSTKRGLWAASSSLFGTSTGGYIPVPLELRGTVDSNADSTNKGLALRLERRLIVNATAFLAASLYGEARQNGTNLQTNGATLRELRAGFDLNSASLGSFATRLYGGTETLRQIFTSISADRNTEALTRNQGVPASQFGGSLLWSRPSAARQLLVAGFDLRHVEGESDEYAYQGGTLTSYLRNGGVQLRYGAFVEDRLRLSQRFLLTLSARVDHWSDEDAHSITQLISSPGPSARTALPSRSGLVFDPRIALFFAPNSRWTFSTSAARAFRVPTLNELYRAFRVGNVSTLANATLQDERSSIAQGSVLYSPTALTSFRATGFWNGINDPVSSVTLSSTPTLITRQRQNLGSLRAAGMEAATSLHFRAVRIDAAYQYAHSTVTSFAANPTLVGLWIPQVPRHSTSVRATYVRQLWILVLDARYFGRQFDDDRNLFSLTGAFVANAAITRTLPNGFSAYIAGDNVLDRRYAVARTPTLSTAPPAFARAGVRWQSRER
jgi:outer membrane receptor protein involved in Fe transport